MAENRVDVQLQKAREMRQTVIDFSNILMYRMKELDETLQYYVKAGFPSDIARTYHARYYTPDNEVITQLSKKMRTEHVEFLDKVIANLKEAGEIQ